MYIRIANGTLHKRTYLALGCSVAGFAVPVQVALTLMPTQRCDTLPAASGRYLLAYPKYSPSSDLRLLSQGVECSCSCCPNGQRRKRAAIKLDICVYDPY